LVTHLVNLRTFSDLVTSLGQAPERGIRGKRGKQDIEPALSRHLDWFAALA
jgi:hypothetical protein